MIKRIGYGKLLVLLVCSILFINSVTAQEAVCVGEAAPLFTAASKIYLNEPLNSVRSVLVDTELPGLLTDGRFDGNVLAEYTQTIEIGSYPKVVFAKQPTSFNDPVFGLMLSPVSSRYLYKTVIAFGRAVDFTHLDSKGREIKLFGREYLISPETNLNELILIHGLKLNLGNVGGRRVSEEISVDGRSYTVALVAASDTAALVKVTTENGISEEKEIIEGGSKRINGLTIGIIYADETNFGISALLIVETDERVILLDGSSVKVGIDERAIDGSAVNIDGGVTGLTKLEILIFAPDSDRDALLLGNAFTDSVFGTFKVDFTNLNIGENEDAKRDSIVIRDSGDNKMMLSMKEHRGHEKEFQWAKAYSNSNDRTELEWDDDGRKIHVLESELVKRNGYVVLGNEAEGYLVKVSTITNQSGTTDDKVEFTDVFSGETYKSSGITTDGQASIVIGGKVYTVRYGGTSSDDSNWVRVDYPDSVRAGNLVIYPTIETSKGAKVAIYANKTINLLNSDGLRNKLSILRLPDGDGFTDVIFTDKGNGIWNIVSGANSIDLDTSPTRFSQVSINIGGFSYRIKGAGSNQVQISLENPEAGTEINSPALVIFEEKDHKAVYNAMIVTLEPGNTADDGIGIDDVIRTWSKDAEWDSIALVSDSKKSKEADIYGSIVTIDSSDSDQKTATISYPDEQTNAMIYVSSDNCPAVEKTFIRGDSDRDGRLTMTDAIKILNSIIFVGPNTLTCMDAADVNDDGSVSETDAIRLLNYLFRSGRAPSLPYPAAGNDPTADRLSCEV